MLAPVGLADRVARDPGHVGVKAARLAAAAAAGLPVLAGRVLPTEASSDAVARGSGKLEDGSGVPAAYLTAMDTSVPGRLAEELVPGTTSDDQLLVVRSSTALDDDGRWSGAFTSYLGVRATDLPTAVKGCWASAFSADAIDRCRETDVEVGSLRIGVLVQPFVAFEAGGTARVLEDGRVVVTAAPGGPAGVVGGRSGHEVTVGVDGRVQGLEDAFIGAATVRAAAALARRAAETVSAGVIEWGARGDNVVLLQVGPEPPAKAEQPGVGRGRPTRMPVDAERIARLVTAFPGPLGEELVLPWAVADGATLDDEIRVHDPRSALREVRTLADELTAATWGAAPPVAGERAAALFRLLLEGLVVEGCRKIRNLSVPDTAAARRLVGLVRGLGGLLTDRGVLPSAPLVWRLTVPELEDAIEGGRPTLRRGPGRWEPFVADVVRARGVHVTGTPVSPGIAAGHLHSLRKLRSMRRPGPRDVLMTPLPLPHLAPLLWHSSALVSLGGSSGAHLFEVARSLGVPSVIGVDATVAGAPGSLIAVDGDTGVISILPAGGTSTSPCPTMPARWSEV